MFVEMFQFNRRRNTRRFSIEFTELIKERINYKVKAIVNRYFTENPNSRNVFDDNGESLLHLATKWNNVKIVKFLLESGCDANIENSLGLSPLIYGLCYNHVEIIEALTDSQSQIFKLNHIETALRLLILKKHIFPTSTLTAVMKRLGYREHLEEIAKLLVKVKCPMDMVLYANYPPLTDLFLNLAVVCPELNDQLEQEIRNILQYVTETAGLNNHSKRFGRNHIISHLEPLAVQMCKSIYHAGVFIDIPFCRWAEFLTVQQYLIYYFMNVFVYADKPEIHVLLQNYNVDVEFKKTYGHDVLPLLFQNRSLDLDYLHNLISERQFDVDAKCWNGSTALHVASSRPDAKKCITLLLELGANCNATDEDGLTPLCYALNHLESLQMLLQIGADPYVPDNDRLMLVDKLYHKTAWEVIIPRLAIDHYKGTVKITDSDLQFRINRQPNYKSLYEVCLSQVTELMNRNILPFISLFDVITKEPNCISHVFESDENISKIMERLCPQSLNYYYYSSIQSELEKAYNIYEAKCRLAAIISENTTKLIGFNHLVVGRIHEYLTHYRDVQALALA